ncbi:dihydroceramidase [Coccidioides immitis RS]|uniref:Dihydroceramidase n=4 Tax=Coccidioides immitis TaxID=5501 RepID=J3KIP4_COCIM|nr:dihydroceramidase [Coccidioides immitis RS]KMP01145.1 phytoceramidase [Coccidioides immitis RMSCC 2394]KMU74272.1 phytoceramidase [Coccidioides immitis RMSCC 3703]KMU83649.1 phytoceramidase [Coccidioides immitis H538.4]TPX25944.1 hypothetical protein DIZ76_011402 [Coccidioides immitis]EAS35856.3 dihydroceramidase [Coccidioides immitis RS]
MAIFGWTYPSPPPAGFWSPRTSTMNFCELDYIVTPYIAEFVNTMSNLAYLYLAWRGLFCSERRAGDYAILLSYLQLAGVGVGSIAFHSTLKFPAQIVDEMAMLYATATVIYAVFAFRLRPLVQLMLGLSFFTGSLVITILHIQQENSLAHRVCFALMVIVVAARCTWLLRGVGNAAIRSEMKRLALVGSVTFLAGFLLWLVDVFSCDDLRGIRQILGMPLGMLLELHSWWHILTAFGVYYYLIFVEYIRLQSGVMDRGAVVRLSRDYFLIPRLVALPEKQE